MIVNIQHPEPTLDPAELSGPPICDVIVSIGGNLSGKKVVIVGWPLEFPANGLNDVTNFVRIE